MTTEVTAETSEKPFSMANFIKQQVLGVEHAAMETRPELAPKTTVPHLVATFKGEYYRGTPGALEAMPFEEEVLIPLEWIENEDFTPPYTFLHHYASRVLKGNTKYPGYGGVRRVDLMKTWCPSTDSKLPKHINYDCQLNWTAEYEDLITEAKRQKEKYPIYENRDGTRVKVSDQSVTINSNLFSSVSSLRNAIKEIRKDPEGFDKLQMERERIAPYLARKEGEQNLKMKVDAQLKDLGY